MLNLQRFKLGPDQSYFVLGQMHAALRVSASRVSNLRGEQNIVVELFGKAVTIISVSAGNVKYGTAYMRSSTLTIDFSV